MPFDPRIVGRDHQRRAVLLRLSGQQLDCARRRLVVQARRRFVGKEKFRTVHHRAGDGDALLLALAQLARPACRLVCDAERGERLAGLRVVLREPGGVPCEAHVVQHGEVRDQMHRLEHDADGGAAPAVERRAAQGQQVFPGHSDAARARAHQPGNDMEQRGFPAARGAVHQPALAGCRVPGRQPQHFRIGVAVRQALNGDHCRKPVGPRGAFVAFMTLPQDVSMRHSLARWLRFFVVLSLVLQGMVAAPLHAHEEHAGTPAVHCPQGTDCSSSGNSPSKQHCDASQGHTPTGITGSQCAGAVASASAPPPEAPALFSAHVPELPSRPPLAVRG